MHHFYRKQTINLSVTTESLCQCNQIGDVVGCIPVSGTVYIKRHSLYCIRWWIDSQCRERWTNVTWSCGRRSAMYRVIAAFNTIWSGAKATAGRQPRERRVTVVDPREYQCQNKPQTKWSQTAATLSVTLYSLCSPNLLENIIETLFLHLSACFYL